MTSRAFALASISACLLLACEARSQSFPQLPPDSPSAPQRNSSAQKQEDRSPYLGNPVAHPEDLSGLWEAPDGYGGSVGIHLLLDTTAPVDATTLVGTRQSWLGLAVGLYRHPGTELQLGDENVFSDSLRGGSVRYEQGRLTLHAPGYDLDLRRVSGDKWSGRFHRENFDSEVTLARPTLRAAWPIGTWKGVSGSQIICLHIAETSPAGFLAWSDTLEIWGPASFSALAAKPPYSWERYGDLAKVHPAGSHRVSIELSAYNPLCCSHPFTATSADNGKAMKADWPAGPNQSPHKSRWTKMPGNACIAPAPQ